MKTRTDLFVLLVCSFAFTQTPAPNKQPDPVHDPTKRNTAKLSTNSWLNLLDARDYFDN